MNLVVNARDAMPSGGVITIDTANTALSNADSGGTFAVVPGHYVRLAVGDTGVGMSPRCEGPGVRSLLHDQAARTRHRAGALDGLRHREAERRLHLGRFGARKGDTCPHLPAALGRGGRLPRPSAPRHDRRVVEATRRSSSSKTKPACAIRCRIGSNRTAIAFSQRAMASMRSSCVERTTDQSTSWWPTSSCQRWAGRRLPSAWLPFAPS